MATARRFQVQFEVSGDGKVQAEFVGVADGAKKAERAVDDAGAAADRTDARYKKLEKSAKAAGVVLGTALVAGLVLFVKNTIEAEQQQAQLGAVLKSTGDAAGYSLDQLNAMAAGMAKASIFSSGEINTAQTRLLSYTNIVGKEFPRALQIALDQSARLGIGIEQSAEIVGRALGEPTKAMAALSQQGFSFDEQQKQTIKTLEATGRTAEAQALIMDMLEESYAGAAQAARNTLGGALKALQNNFNDLLTGDTGGEGIKGTTEAVNSLADTMGSPEVREAFQSMVSGIAMVSNELVKGTSLIVNYIANWSRMKALGSGDLSRSDASYEDLNQRLGRVGGALKNIDAGKSVGSGILLPGETTVTPARRKQVVDRLMAERDLLMREITARIKAEQASENAAPADAASRFGADYELSSLNFDPNPKATASTTTRTKAVKELTQADKDLVELEEVYATIVGLTAEAQAKAVIAEGDKLAAQQAGMERTDQLIADMEFELALIGMTNTERERAIALRYADAAATSEQRAEIEELAGRLMAERDSIDRQVAGMDSVRESARGLLGDLRAGVDIWDAMTNALQRFANRLLDLAMDQTIAGMFGERGDTGGGAWGGALAAMFKGMFGGGRASGGPVSGSKLYEVGEGGEPELFRKGDRTFLIPGSDGVVSPVSRGGGAFAPMAGGRGGAGPVNITIHGAPSEPEVNVSQGAGGLDVEVIFKQLEGRMAGNVASGSGPLYMASKSRFGLRDQT